MLSNVEPFNAPVFCARAFTWICTPILMYNSVSVVALQVSVLPLSARNLAKPEHVISRHFSTNARGNVSSALFEAPRTPPEPSVR